MTFLFRFFASFVLTWAFSGGLHGAAAQPQPPAPAPAPSALTPIFVLNSLDDSVSVIDPQSWLETKRIETGKQPHHL